jgi:hypothetical protein
MPSKRAPLEDSRRKNSWRSLTFLEIHPPSTLRRLAGKPWHLWQMRPAPRWYIRCGWSSTDCADAARLRVGLDAGPPRLEPVEDGLEGALATWLWRFVAARREGRWRRVKLCEACGRVFYDHSRPILAKWCSTRCSDRLRGRRYQRRMRRRQREYSREVQARKRTAHQSEQRPVSQDEEPTP